MESQTNLLSIEPEYPNQKDKQDLVSDAVEEIEQLEDSKDNRISVLEVENKQLQNRVNELKALVKQMSDTSRSELLEIGIALLNKAGVFDNMSNKLSLTPEILDIINRSNQQQQQQQQQ